MEPNIFQKFSEIPVREIASGFFARPVHTENNTINFLQVKAGSEMKLHNHPHEQSSYVLEGEFEMTVNGETKILTANDFVVIPGMVWHSGKAITDCKLVDVFSPVREDFR